MKTKTESILEAMHVLSWIVFIGLLIQGGAILVSYLVSMANPEGAKKLYDGLDLFPLRESSIWHYSIAVLSLIALSGLKAYTAYLVIQILSKINLENPFQSSTAILIERVSYVILEIWVLSMLANGHQGWLRKYGLDRQEHWNSGEFIFLAGVIFIIAQVFKKGVEIQSENELTI